MAAERSHGVNGVSQFVAAVSGRPGSGEWVTRQRCMYAVASVQVEVASVHDCGGTGAWMRWHRRMLT
jgi:hypothetical protein